MRQDAAPACGRATHALRPAQGPGFAKSCCNGGMQGQRARVFLCEWRKVRDLNMTMCGSSDSFERA